MFGALIGVTQISNAEDNETTAGKTVNGLEILANDCSDSELTPHDGFQNGDRCVSTEFGELASADKNPTLLITEAPRSVRAGQPFRLKVSTRNLVRDRFLAAGKGGYYVESSVLTAEGLVRGHFHTACRMLSSTREANDPAPVPAFFVATEDGKGGGQPDTVTIEVPGMPTEGTAQCASWAGDGSHRIPMMQRANQTPAFDAVRIRVRGQQPPAEEPPAEQPPAEQPPAEQPPAEQPPAEQPPAEQPPAAAGEQPPAEQPPAEQPPAEQPPAEQPPAEQPPADSGSGGGNQPPAEEEGDGATAPANPPAVPTSQPTTKSTVKRDNPPPATNNDTDSADTSDSSDDDNTPAAPKSKSGAKKSKTSTADEAESDTASDRAEAPKPKPSASSKAAADLQSDEDTGAPDEEIDTQAAEPAPAPASENRLALTGVNSVAMICGGALLVLIGLIVINSMRRRRPHWR